LPPAAGFAVAVRRSPREAVRPLATHATRNQGTGAPLLLGSPSWGWLGVCWILVPVGPALQHRPHGPHEVVTGGHKSDFLALGITLLDAIEEGADGRRTPPRLPGGFSHEPPDHRSALAGDVAEAIPFAGLVLAWNQAEVTTDRFRTAETVWIIDEGCQGFRCSNPDARNAPQLTHGRSLVRPAIQLLLKAPQLAV
jgi:hypothetical protein